MYTNNVDTLAYLWIEELCVQIFNSGCFIEAMDLLTLGSGFSLIRKWKETHEPEL